MRTFSEPINSALEEKDDFEIKDFFPVVDDKTLSLYLRLKNERDVIFDNLPAGYKRLYSIAFDLAYRLYILRKTNEEDPKGIAIIDEIDLHLHPSLEQEVLARLKKHFQVFNLLYLHILQWYSPILKSKIREI